MSDSDIWRDTQNIFLETEKILMDSINKCNPHPVATPSMEVSVPLVTTFANPNLPLSQSAITTPSIDQASFLAPPLSNHTAPNNTIESVMKEPLHISEPLNEQRLSNAEALQILQLCSTRNYKLRPCKNTSRGCAVNTYFTITDLHENFCPLNVSVKLKVEGNMNLFMSTSKKFRPFCKTFIKQYDVNFLYKKNSIDNGIKIYVSGYTRRYKFTISFLSKDFTIIHKIVGFTNSDIYKLPPHLMDTHGPLLTYQIKIQK